MPTSIDLDDSLRERIERLARQQQRSVRGLMVDAIAEYVRREEARDSFQQEAVQAWADFRQSGQHLTGDEVRGWLKSWGTEEETAVPPCHD